MERVAAACVFRMYSPCQDEDIKPPSNAGTGNFPEALPEGSYLSVFSHE
jgi:hypothetical protein